MHEFLRLLTHTDRQPSQRQTLRVPGAWLVLLVCCVAGVSHAQDDAAGRKEDAGQDGKTVLHTTTREVLLDVIVTDKNGNTVRNLSPQDFVVKENGVEQKAHVIEVPGTGPASTQAATSGAQRGVGEEKGRSNTAERMRTLILLDEVNVKFFDLAFARQRLDVFLASDKAKDQQIGLLALTGKRLVMVHEFTTDREALRKALRRLPPAIPGTANAAVDEYTDYQNFTDAISALETIARSLQGSPVRTNCVWITSGFPTMVKLVNSPEVEDNFNILMQHTANLYLGARMSVYTIDPHGVQFESSLPNHDAQPRTVPVGGQVADIDNGMEIARQTVNMTSNSAVMNGFLNQLDERTGGRGYSNQNELDSLMGKVLDDADSSYLLAYTPIDRSFHGEYRKIRVELRQRGLHARTRDGYLATPEGAEQRSTELVRKDLQHALESPLAYGALHVAAKLDKVGSRPVVQVRLTPENVEWRQTGDGPMGDVAQLIVVAAYSAKGKPLSNRGYRVATKRPETEQNHDLRYSVPVSLPAQTARMRVAVIDLNGTHLGTAEVEGAGLLSETGAGLAVR